MTYYDRRGNPTDLMTWAREFENDDRIIKQTRHKEKGKEFKLSTVFLGLDHQYGIGPPLIFETMAFEIKPTSWNSVIGEADYGGFYQDRYSTEDQALEGHNPWKAIKEDY